jgi:ribosomal protein S18 acetylase RimI-like enzyme
MAIRPIEIRSAARSEMKHAIAVIVSAFIADPPARFAWPSPYDYLENMPLATRAFAGSCFEHETAYVSADLCGVALWLPPGVEPESASVEKMFRETAKPEHLDDLLATFERMEQSHPREPHWYLPQIGVDPQAQGKGIGEALMRHALERCDKERTLAYLEASKPANIPFYERHGFEVVAQIKVGAGPLVTPMFRRPLR